MDECDIPVKVRGFGEKVKEVVVEGATDRQSWRGTGLATPTGSFEGSNKPARPPARQLFT